MNEKKAVEVNGATITIDPTAMAVGKLYKFKTRTGEVYGAFKTTTGEVVLLEEWDTNEKILGEKQK